tara:strand:+ start:99 stop:425 length:327 start_codon:yes stop_codon:yes gene_type:complete
MNEVAARYPRTIDLGGNSIEFSLMTETDQALTAAFAETLADHDLLFLSRNIREPKVVAAWLKQIEAGEIVSVAARLDGKIVGTTAIVVDRLSFSAHVGDIRVLVGGDA